MNKINKINQLNLNELGQPIEASWHQDYKDSKYIFISHLHENIQEKDLIIIFSQYGLPTHVKLVSYNNDEQASDNNHDKSGKGKKYAFLKFEKWESCVMSIDNLNGIIIMGSKILVDHCWFNLKNGETEDQYKVNYDDYLPKMIKDQEELNKDEESQGNQEVKDVKNEDNKRALVEDEGDEDEFKDPMMEFLSTKHRRSDKHRSRKHSHKHRHRHDDKPKDETEV